MQITFITGNSRKFSEAEAVLGMPLAQAAIHLPELQDLDIYAVMQHKLEAAKAHGILPCIVEDSSLTLSCLGGKLPGPFIKQFQEALDIGGIVELTERYEDPRALSTTLVGYLDTEGKAHVFEGSVAGEIVPLRGENDFGFGPAFVPEGWEKTFGEMSREEKHAASGRAIAFRKLKDHLDRSAVY